LLFIVSFCVKNVTIPFPNGFPRLNESETDEQRELT